MPISRLVRRFPRRSLAITAAPLCTALALLSLVLAPADAFASDSPGNYYYGADSGNPTALGTGPYTMPTVGGTFGVYVAEDGPGLICRDVQVTSID